MGHSKKIFEKTYSKLIKKLGKERVESREDYFINAIKNETEKFDELYEMLEDKKSKRLFDKIIKMRMHYAFEQTAKKSRIKLFFFCLKKSPINFLFWGVKLIVYMLFIRVFQTKTINSLVLFNTLFIKQYEIKGICEAENGDTVFDVGAFLGDTAIYFEKKCGEGKVYSFEPVPEFCKEINNVAKKTKAINMALGDRKSKVYFENDGVCSGISESGKIEAEMTTLDEYVKDASIDKIDFIKVDIEGAEREMLCGGKETILKHRPKLDIAIYHGGKLNYMDFYTLPKIIKNITPGYKYYLRHFTPWWDDTFLFCVPQKRYLL